MLTPQNAWLPRCATCHLPPPPPQRVREDRRKAPSPPPPSHGDNLQADQSRFGNPSHDSIRSETALVPLVQLLPVADFRGVSLLADDEVPGEDDRQQNPNRNNQLQARLGVPRSEPKLRQSDRRTDEKERKAGRNRPVHARVSSTTT